MVGLVEPVVQTIIVSLHPALNASITFGPSHRKLCTANSDATPRSPSGDKDGEVKAAPASVDLPERLFEDCLQGLRLEVLPRGLASCMCVYSFLIYLLLDHLSIYPP